MSPATTTTTTESAPLIIAPSDAVLPLGVPVKFSSQGEIQPYPGNTTICHLPTASPLKPGLRKVYEVYKNHGDLSKYWRALPPESWHVTIFDGVRTTECEPGMWPEGVEKEPLSEATRKFKTRLEELGPQLEEEGLAPPYRMRVNGFDPSQCGAGLDVQGVDAEEQQRLRRLRDRLSEVCGFRAPNHERYNLHLTIAYLLLPIYGKDKKEIERLQKELMPELAVEFELGSLEFCTFENMDHFERLIYVSG